jgi:hypothetical protein
MVSRAGVEAEREDRERGERRRSEEMDVDGG